MEHSKIELPEEWKRKKTGKPDKNLVFITWTVSIAMIILVAFFSFLIFEVLSGEKSINQIIYNTNNTNTNTVPASNDEDTDDTELNGSGNYCNNGLAFVNDQWIYYVNEEGYIYRKSLGDGKIEGLSKTIDGKYIYIINKKVYFLSNKSALIRMNLDGSDMETLSDNFQASHILITGNAIYGNSQDASLSSYSVFKTDLEGENRQTLVSSTNSRVFMDCVYKGKIYYISQPLDYSDSVNTKSEIFTTDLSGGNKQIVYSGSGVSGDMASMPDNYINYLVVSGDWIYYANDVNSVNDTQPGHYAKISKMNLDGSNIKVLVNEDVYGALNVKGDYVYYASYRGIERMKTDGSENEIIYSGTVTDGAHNRINLAGDWIYFYTSDGTSTRMKTDGTSLQQVN